MSSDSLGTPICSAGDGTPLSSSYKVIRERIEYICAYVAGVVDGCVPFQKCLPASSFCFACTLCITCFRLFVSFFIYFLLGRVGVSGVVSRECGVSACAFASPGKYNSTPTCSFEYQGKASSCSFRKRVALEYCTVQLDLGSFLSGGSFSRISKVWK